MCRRVSTAIALRIVAVFAAISCAGPIAVVHGGSLATAVPRPLQLFDGRAFAAALPAALTPPALDPDLRFVSMVAADIDADGDLDVVASNGSLDLVVWTNDGTGHLTRKYPERSSGGLDQRPAQTLDHEPAAGGGALPAGGLVCCLRSETRLGLVFVAAHPFPQAPAGTPDAAAVRTPRAPPSSTV
jgi:hypothetical protein